MFIQSLILGIQLVQLAVCDIYYVVPDNHHFTNINTYTLQHYLNNTSKYFVSGTELHFLAGKYYLNTKLKLENIANFSLIGNQPTGKIYTIINCTPGGGITIVNSKNVLVSNIVMQKWVSHDNNVVNLQVLDCYGINITNFHTFSYPYANRCSLYVENVFTFLVLRNIVSDCLVVSYTYLYWFDKYVYMNAAVEISNYKTIIAMPSYALSIYSMQILFAGSYNITMKISDSNFNSCTAISIQDKDDYNVPYYKECLISIIKCKFTYTEGKCKDNFPTGESVIRIDRKKLVTGMCGRYVLILVENCIFSSYEYGYIRIIKTDTAGCFENKIPACLNVLIKNTTFLQITCYHHIIDIFKTNMYFEGPVIFSNIRSKFIIKAISSYLQFHTYIEMTNNSVVELIDTTEIYLKEETTLNFTNNKARSLFSLPRETLVPLSFRETIPIEMLVWPCLFQYLSTHGMVDSINDNKSLLLKYYILVSGNEAWNFLDVKYRTSYCSWQPNTAFEKIYPQYVNQKFIHFHNNTFTNYEYKEICICHHMYMNSSNCTQDSLGSVYPGELITFQFTLVNSYSEGLLRIEDTPQRACRGHTVSIDQVINNKTCSIVKYIMQYRTGGYCELYVTVSEKGVGHYHYNTIRDTYYILLLPCPIGFTLSNIGHCNCDPVLVNALTFTICDINSGTILCPSNGWISATAVYNSHTYDVSLKCPFDYCLPHSTHINLSIPDSSCQFNRHGLLCGHCRPDLSAVFGSSNCKYCSNGYLLITIPFAIAGITLVFVLFILNLTVTDGNVNAFLLYFNIISINSAFFFQNDIDSFIFPYAFISLANLDLGIETCYYNGMDDYAKMWLQLAFPTFIILIATSLIIASRYSAMIQRITARRALPVLATLFLLSYTKILRTVCSVMFFYSTITHLPGGQTKVVWSVDANIPLFEAKFTILFIACFLLFLALIPFNVILLFTRTLSQAKFINYFKPLLDAFQGPYKDQFYYWTGLQLALRAVFFGLSALDRSTNLTISITLLGVMISIHAYVLPFKDKTNNVLELFLLLNLQILFTMANYSTFSLNAIAVNVLIAITFLLLIYLVLRHGCLHILQHVDVINSAKRIKKIFILLNKSSSANSIQQIQLRHVPPDVTYNYKEFQEPLVAL